MKVLPIDYSSLAGPLAQPTDARADNAAADFEALLIGQMLKHARETGAGGWLGGGEDGAGSGMVEFAEQQIAKTIAGAGGLGLTKALNLTGRLQSPGTE